MKFRLPAILTLTLCGGAAWAAPFQIDEPAGDRWMYPFNQTPGTRSGASVFGAAGESGFDDRDAQYFLRFDTTGIAAAGLGASNYGVSSLRLAITVNVDNQFVYDPTRDALGTYLDPMTDADSGRPIELFGTGYRNGTTAATFNESSPFTTGSGTGAERTRDAFAAGFDGAGTLGDVSNNVRDGFEVSPWAIGQISMVTPGSLVPIDSVMTFDLELSDPFILAYVQDALNAGSLDLMVTGISATSQMAGSGFPSFYTKDDFFHQNDRSLGLAGRLSGDLTAVPEPSVIALVGLAGLFLLGRWRRARI